MMALGGSYHHPFQTSQYFIQRSEQEALDMAPVIGVTLYHADQVININIPMLDRPWMPMVPMVLRLGHLSLTASFLTSAGIGDSDIASRR
jgi:hypothetical protein